MWTLTRGGRGIKRILKRREFAAYAS